MNKELVTFQKALETFQNAPDGKLFKKVQDAATAYVDKYPDEFEEHRALVSGSESEKVAREKIIGQIQTLREAAATLDGAAKDTILEHMLIAEAWLQHRWHPLDIGGYAGPQPEVRNPGDVAPEPDGDVAPRVRKTQ